MLARRVTWNCAAAKVHVAVMSALGFVMRQSTWQRARTYSDDFICIYTDGATVRSRSIFTAWLCDVKPLFTGLRYLAARVVDAQSDRNMRPAGH